MAMTRDTSNRLKGGFATRAIHTGHNPADQLGALTPPVFMTSTYAFETAEAGGEIFRGEREGYVYGRTRNPTQALFEACIAGLENAEAGLAVASGMAAISSTLWTLLQAGDEVLIDHTLYGNSFALFVRGLTRFRVKVAVADFTDLNAAAAAIAKGAPKLVFFETPANPNLRLIDIAAIGRMAHEAGALLIVDNTFATPALQQRILLGADLVVHSATKFIGGHGDLIAGAVVGSGDIIERDPAPCLPLFYRRYHSPADRVPSSAWPQDTGAAHGTALLLGPGHRPIARAASCHCLGFLSRPSEFSIP
jgi:methionine-gamma-lyase